MPSKLQYFLSRLSERLWVKPLIACILSVAGVLLAHLADNMQLDWKIPEIPQGSVIDLLRIVAGSMLGIATFAVASMVAAYASTGKSATARAFPLIVSDDVSQNALSVFVAAFIFSIVAFTATTTDYYGKAGRFTLFVLLLAVLAIVVLVFVRWVDSIARLGRLAAVMAKVESATEEAIRRRKHHPYLGGLIADGPPQGTAFYAERVGSLQRIDVEELQHIAKKCKFRITVAVLPGALIGPSRPLGFVHPDSGNSGPVDPQVLRRAFMIGPRRHFDEDPRFGLVVLSEIACRALSPGINDPGTAIGILGAFHRLFTQWATPVEPHTPRCDRVLVPALSTDDMFNDAFPAIARDGGHLVEVAARLQRILGELARLDHDPTKAAAKRHADMAIARAERVLAFAPDLEHLCRRYADYWHRQPDSPAPGPAGHPRA